MFTSPAGGELLEVSRDAQRFLGAVPQDQRTAHAPITVVLNWQEKLKQRMPTK